MRLECLEVGEERDVRLGGGVAGGGRDVHGVFSVLGGGGGGGGGGPSVQVVGGSYRTSICGRDLLPCRGRSSMKAGCRSDVGKRSRYWRACRCTGRRLPGWRSCGSSGRSPNSCGTAWNETSSRSWTMSSASWWQPWGACQAGVQSG